MAFLIYDAKVAVALLVFYLFYRFLLKKETFHRFNRFVLVGTAVLSFLLPLCIITIHKPMEMAAPLVTEPAMVAELPEQELAPLAQASEPWWPVALTVLFWAGVAFVLARVLISILSILRIIRQGEPVREEDGCRILVTERNIDPFSWMKLSSCPGKTGKSHPNPSSPMRRRTSPMGTPSKYSWSMSCRPSNGSIPPSGCSARTSRNSTSTRPTTPCSAPAPTSGNTNICS